MAATWTRDNIVLSQNELQRMGVTNPAELGFVILVDEVPVHNSFETKMVKTDGVMDGKVVYIEQPLTIEEKIAKLKEYSKNIIYEVDCYMDVAISYLKGYTSRDSIGKYLVEGNPFYGECREMSLWIASCYVKCYEIEVETIEGRRTVPTIDEVINELPNPTFLSEDETVRLKNEWKKFINPNLFNT